MKLLEELAWCCWPRAIPAADIDSWPADRDSLVRALQPALCPTHQLQHPHGEVTSGAGEKCGGWGRRPARKESWH